MSLLAEQQRIEMPFVDNKWQMRQRNRNKQLVFPIFDHVDVKQSVFALHNFPEINDSKLVAEASFYPVSGIPEPKAMGSFFITV